MELCFWDNAFCKYLSLQHALDHKILIPNIDFVDFFLMLKLAWGSSFSRKIEEDRNEFCDDVNFQVTTPLEVSKLLPFMIKFSANVQLEKITFWVYFGSLSYIISCSFRSTIGGYFKFLLGTIWFEKNWMDLFNFLQFNWSWDWYRFYVPVVTLKLSLLKELWFYIRYQATI